MPESDRTTGTKIQPRTERAAPFPPGLVRRNSGKLADTVLKIASKFNWCEKKVRPPHSETGKRESGYNDLKSI